MGEGKDGVVMGGGVNFLHLRGIRTKIFFAITFVYSIPDSVIVSRFNVK